MTLLKNKIKELSNRMYSKVGKETCLEMDSYIVNALSHVQHGS